MKKAPLLVLLALLSGACQLFFPTTPPALHPHNPGNRDNNTAGYGDATATTIPTLSNRVIIEEILATLPFTTGTQPNGIFVIQEIQQADLTGRTRRCCRYQRLEAERDGRIPCLLQVDIVSAEGILSMSKHLGRLGESPSTMALDEYSFLMFNQIEAVDIVALTGDPTPQVVVRIRYSGTGSILEAHILSFRGGAMQSLADITAYKGWMEYQRDGYVLSYPLISTMSLTAAHAAERR
jgi:hypothetical protein